MTNVVRCQKCTRQLIADELADHKCKIQVGEVLRIVDVDYEWWTSSILEGYGEVVIVKDARGTLYRMKPHHPKSDTQTGHLEEGTVYTNVH